MWILFYFTYNCTWIPQLALLKTDDTGCIIHTNYYLVSSYVRSGSFRNHFALKNYLPFGAQEHSLACSSHMQKDEILKCPYEAFDQHTKQKSVVVPLKFRMPKIQILLCFSTVLKSRIEMHVDCGVVVGTAEIRTHRNAVHAYIFRLLTDNL